MPVDGSGAPEQLTSADILALPSSVSPDGASLAFVRDAAGGVDAWLLDLVTGEEEELFARPGTNELEPRFSPDGRWVAYASDDGVLPEVYVRPYSGPGGETKISNEGGWDALWAPDGSTLYFRNGRNIMKVAIELEPEFKAGRPELLFRSPDLGDVKYFRAWDIAPDGKSFIAVERGPAPSELHVVFNWFSELERLVPAGNQR